MRHGGHPVQSFYLGIPTNATIAASMAGTAAATLICTATSAYATFMEVFNLTGRNFELVIGNDYGTTAYTATTPGTTPVGTSGTQTSQFFVPGTASSTVASGRGNYFPVTISPLTQIWLRTTENTAITAASVTPIVIVLWT